MIKVPELNLTFSLISQETPSHGDTVYFGFINYNNHIRTYCYLAQSQIDEIGKAYKVVKSKVSLDPEIRANWMTKLKAQKEKFFFNVGYIPVFQDTYIEGAVAFFNRFKKVPFLLFSLSDKPEIFHKQSRTVSYKKLKDVRTSDFTHKKGEVHDHKISYQIKNISNLKDLTLFIFGEDSREARKLVFDIIWKTYHEDDFELNYSMIRLVWLMRNFFSHTEMVYLFKNELNRIKKMDLYDYINHLDHRNEKNYSGIIEFFKNIPEFNDRKRLFLKFNIPQHVVRYFSEVMSIAYPVLKPEISRTSDALYFYNALSRDYGRLKLPNSPFVPKAKFNPMADYLNGKKLGDYRFEVPKDYHSRIDWGSKLCNCAGNFDQIEVYNKCLPVAIFYKNELKWLLSVGNDRTKDDLSNLKVTQFKGYKNSNPKRDEMTLLMSVFEGKLGEDETIESNIKSLLKKEGDLF